MSSSPIMVTVRTARKRLEDAVRHGTLGSAPLEQLRRQLTARPDEVRKDEGRTELVSQAVSTGTASAFATVLADEGFAVTLTEDEERQSVTIDAADVVGGAPVRVEVRHGEETEDVEICADGHPIERVEQWLEALHVDYGIEITTEAETALPESRTRATDT